MFQLIALSAASVLLLYYVIQLAELGWRRWRQRKRQLRLLDTHGRVIASRPLPAEPRLRRFG